MLARFIECLGSFQECFFPQYHYNEVRALENAVTSLIETQMSYVPHDRIFSVYDKGVEVTDEFTRKILLRAFVMRTSYYSPEIRAFQVGVQYGTSNYQFIFHQKVHVVDPGKIENPLSQSILAQLDNQPYSTCIIYSFVTDQTQETKENVCLTTPIAFYARKSKKLTPDSNEPRFRHCVATTLIGQGGVAFVYRGKTVIPNKETALPFFKQDKPHQGRIVKEEICSTDPKELRSSEYNLKHESMILQQLEYQHSKDVSEISLGNQYQSHLLNVSRLFEGCDLMQYIQSRHENFICGNRELDIAISIASNLVLIHDVNIIHRDLKPENMMLDDSTIRIIDFGLSRLQSEISTKPNRGTFKYMAPESAKGKANDEKSDVFSTGIVFVILFNGYYRLTKDQIERADKDGFTFLENEFQEICEQAISLDGVCENTSYSEATNIKLREIISQMLIVKEPDQRITAKKLLQELLEVKELEDTPRNRPSR